MASLYDYDQLGDSYNCQNIIFFLQDCKDTTEKIDRILRNLQKKDFESFKKFCTALENCAQDHIVRKHLSKVQEVTCRQVTTTDAAINEDSAHCRAISDGMCECFKQHWNDLIAYITFDDGLMSEVEKNKIFTTLQINKLKVSFHFFCKAL